MTNVPDNSGIAPALHSAIDCDSLEMESGLSAHNVHDELPPTEFNGEHTAHVTSADESTNTIHSCLDCTMSDNTWFATGGTENGKIHREV